ncbi:hypothetical protein SLS53_005426 [Cytospora paraplurivora]|uniref:Uncharacterized protein n=1 Tax=Cytospora paraplurivora TaxID=2898453 RepID=A0AAN9U5X9_9PEZI
MQYHGLPPYLLHWLGIVLMSSNQAARWRLGTHMLRSASELGHDPSTLTLVRVLTSMSGDAAAKASRSRIFAEADRRFRQLVQGGADPDALTLQGIILARSGGEDRARRALESFERAERAWEARTAAAAAVSTTSSSSSSSLSSSSSSSSPQDSGSGAEKNDANSPEDEGVLFDPEQIRLPPPREPRWEWETSCFLGRAGILERQGRPDEAAALYRVAALELDNPTGFWKLAQLAGDGPRDSPERRTYLLKAAISGVAEACRELGELEGIVAAGARGGLPAREREERAKMSREWFRLADGEELKSIQNEALDE